MNCVLALGLVIIDMLLLLDGNVMLDDEKGAEDDKPELLPLLLEEPRPGFEAPNNGRR